MTQAIILAAGRGSRMGGLTESLPKCLTPLMDKTLLEWQISSLKQGGIDTVNLITGYKAHKLPTDLYQFHNTIWNDTNMVYSLYQADSILSKDTCIISYSDICYHPSTITDLLADTNSFTISYDELWEQLWSIRFNNPLDDAESFELSNSKLLSIGKRCTHMNQIQGQYMGLLKITPPTWLKIKHLLHELPLAQFKKIDMTTLLRLCLDNNIDIHTVPTKGKWCEVDTESDLNIYKTQLKSDESWQHDWRA